MTKKVLIVEDQFVEANNLQILLLKAGYQVCGIARSVVDALEIIKNDRPDFVLVDILLKGKLTGIDLARKLKEEHIAFIFLSANSSVEVLSAAKTTEPYGFMLKPFREKDLLVNLEIARYRHEHSMEFRYRREEQLLGQLNETLALNLDKKRKQHLIGKLVQQEIPFDLVAVEFAVDDRAPLDLAGLFRVGFEEYQPIGIPELSRMTGLSQTQVLGFLASSRMKPGASILNEEAFNGLAQSQTLEGILERTFHIHSMLSFTIQAEEGRKYKYRFCSRRPDTYNQDHLALLQRMQFALMRTVDTLPFTQHAAASVSAEHHSRDIVDTKSPLSAQPSVPGFIGKSHQLMNVFDQVKQVAPFETSVLILGESGTGKERIADHIHHLSPRRSRPFIKVNCAALPSTLIESELFGHEKGAYTGASDKRIGLFQQADGGTILLDEIGDMTIDMQVKLLRVLQEKEIQPVGGRSSKINVRVIAATNKHLEKEVADGRFRLDLYYRLNVFPITIPPLRERPDDIIPLAEHFVKLFNKKMKKDLLGLTQQAMTDLLSYSWPGNVRELEYMIERAMLIEKGKSLNTIPLPVQRENNAQQPDNAPQLKTIHQNERDHIIQVLKRSGGKIWGPGGAAEILDLPPSTLKSKMKKLGITRSGFN